MSSTSKKPRVVVLGGLKYVDSDYLQDVKNEFEIEVLNATTHKELQEQLPLAIAKKGPFDAMIVTADARPFEPWNEDLLKVLMPSCRIIASAWAGHNNFDVAWLTSQNVWFCNTLDAVAEATADMAMFLTLAVVRNTFVAERRARGGGWSSDFLPSRDTTGMTLGIVGLGSIGRHLARKAGAFNMRVKYYSRRRQGSEVEEKCSNARYCASLHELLSQADVVSINCPLTPETANLISSAEFAAMKDGAFLVNTARGPIVDEDALIEALESGKIARAGLDVFCNEPDIKEYFKTSERVIIQPHMGAWTEEAIRRAERECVENLRAFFRTGQPLSPVNTLT